MMEHQDDVVLAISYSGCTEETLNIVSSLLQIGAKLIALTGRPDSPLAQNADVTLDIGVREEADPLGLAPTNSTTATLALGDALAIAWSVDRGFTREDFGKFHPGGACFINDFVGMEGWKIVSARFHPSILPYKKCQHILGGI